MQPQSMCIQKPLSYAIIIGIMYTSAGWYIYRVVMVRKPIKNRDLLWPSKRYAFLGFIGKNVNIYVTIFNFILF
jgi:hypothetical protein